MARPIIFLGPSLSHEKAKAIFSEADYRPPAKKGDLLQLATNPDVGMVGLVDGVFLQDYPPTPIEVYQLTRREGVLLAGAASLGALRAVELEKFGMMGIGRIFELYKKGKVDDDDEVAVTFSDGNFRIQSEAMIDIRYNLYLAKKQGIISEETKRVMAKIAKGMYFPYRNYDDLINETRKKHPALDDVENFRSYISQNRKSLKEMDAIKLVQFFKDKFHNL